MSSSPAWDPGFPAGVGLWGMKRRGVVEGYLKVERGHTAREAFDRSGLRSEGYGFNELTFELVQDEAPEEPKTPTGRMTGPERGARPEVVRRVRRNLRAQGVAV